MGPAEVSATSHVKLDEALDVRIPGNKLTVTQQMISASAGSIITTAVVNPLDVIKTRLQMRGTLTSWAVLSQMIRREGVRSLGGGLSASILMQIPSSAIYLTIYERLRGRLEQENFSTTSAVVIAGATGRTAAVIVSSPLEYVRTVLQAQDSKTAMRNLRATLAAKGFSSMWVGLVPTLLRDVPFSMIYWTGYERSRAVFERALPLTSWRPVPGSNRLDQAEMMHNFLAGATSGMVAAAVTTPLDLLKTKKQIIAQNPVTDSASLLHIARSTVAVEGFSGLFRGVVPRVVKVAPACAIMITSYEMLKHCMTNPESCRK
eukprot:c4622_g1_i1.p1 GENE.c4622_g1_i1~~c4622_g1_i1.p1  ORF type:complete len:326 (+),score=40.99 c4622_g1_i1:25-978(+)